jgi:hypothetical protein
MWLARPEGMTALPHWKQEISVLVGGWLGNSEDVIEDAADAGDWAGRVIIREQYQ